MPALKRLINLVPQSEFEQSFWGRFLSWAVTSGRNLIIITELIVIVAFLSRFKIDADLDKLNQEVEGQKAILESSLLEEEEFRLVQAKFVAAGRVLKQRLEPDLAFKFLGENQPEEVSLDTLNMIPGTVTLEGQAGSEYGLGLLIQRFLIEEKWKSINIKQITSVEDGSVSFSFTSEYK